MNDHIPGMIPIKQVLAERGKAYGDFCTRAETAQSLKRVLRSGNYWGRLPAHHQEAMENIAQKMARTVNGGTFHQDTWLDIIGYATLVLEARGEECT